MHWQEKLFYGGMIVVLWLTCCWHEGRITELERRLDREVDYFINVDSEHEVRLQQIHSRITERK